VVTNRANWDVKVVLNILSDPMHESRDVRIVEDLQVILCKNIFFMGMKHIAC
jgi:hypothetical protein